LFNFSLKNDRYSSSRKHNPYMHRWRMEGLAQLIHFTNIFLKSYKKIIFTTLWVTRAPYEINKIPLCALSQVEEVHTILARVGKNSVAD
jgi:hypothetical protein